MSPLTKFYKLTLSNLGEILPEFEKSGLIVYKSGEEYRIKNSDIEEPIALGLEYESDFQYIVVVAFRPSPKELEVFEKICEIIQDMGGVEVTALELPI